MRKLHALGMIICATGLVPGWSGAQGDDPSDYNPWDIPGPVYLMDELGTVTAEAEDLAQSASSWIFTSTVPVGSAEPLGDGYVVWKGADGQGGDNLIDHDHTRQGDRSDWLVLKFWTDIPGTCILDVRGYHVRSDGDNDFWIGSIPQPSGVAIFRGIAGTPAAFHWMEFGHLTFVAKRGLNAVFISGRSREYGADRLAVYRQDSEASAARARDITIPASPAFEERDGQTIFDLDRRLRPDAQSGQLLSWLGIVEYDEADYPWFLHSQHGWMHAGPGSPETGAWVLDTQLGYLWFTPASTRWAYSFDRQSWVYHYINSLAPRWFYDSATEMYFSADPSGW